MCLSDTALGHSPLSINTWAQYRRYTTEENKHPTVHSPEQYIQTDTKIHKASRVCKQNSLCHCVMGDTLHPFVRELQLGCVFTWWCFGPNTTGNTPNPFLNPAFNLINQPPAVLNTHTRSFCPKREQISTQTIHEGLQEGGDYRTEGKGVLLANALDSAAIFGPHITIQKTPTLCVQCVWQKERGNQRGRLIKTCQRCNWWILEPVPIGFIERVRENSIKKERDCFGRSYKQRKQGSHKFDTGGEVKL